MIISKFFIDRPVLANVLAIVIVLIGGVSAFSLPIAQYPNIVPPTVSVTTNYPGASASTVVNQVALPVELQVNGVEGMIYMQSTSTDTGAYTLTVTFEIGTDLDFAQVLVQNRVSAALASLPTAVQAQGLTVQKKSTSILEIVSLSRQGRPATTACISATTPPSTWSTSCRACRASATSTCWASASTRCASGSIRRSSTASA